MPEHGWKHKLFFTQACRGSFIQNAKSIHINHATYMELDTYETDGEDDEAK